MSNNAKPYFAPQPKQFPQRVQTQPEQKLNATTDPQYQLVCPCGGEIFDQGLTLYKMPGQLIGSTDLTYASCFVCRECNMPLNVKETKTRKELEIQEKEGA